MARTVAALYSTRAEAETAQARLRAQLQTADVEILSHRDQGSLPRFRFADEDRSHYQRALADGDYLLCAKVPAGEDPARIVRVLEDSSSNPQPPDRAAELRRSPEASNPARGSGRSPGRALFIGDAWIARGGAQVTYVAPEGSRPNVFRSNYSPPATTRFDERELLAAGLLQNRTIEASEMGEVPIIERQPVVREEVVIRKGADERTEIIRGKVRRTAAEVTDLGPEPGRDRHEPWDQR